MVLVALPFYRAETSIASRRCRAPVAVDVVIPLIVQADPQLVRWLDPAGNAAGPEVFVQVHC